MAQRRGSKGVLKGSDRKSVKIDPSAQPISRLLDDSFRTQTQNPKNITINNNPEKSQAFATIEKSTSVSAFLPDIYSPQKQTYSSLHNHSPKSESSLEFLLPAYESDVAKMSRSLIPSDSARMKSISHVKQLEISRIHTNSSSPVGRAVDLDSTLEEADGWNDSNSQQGSRSKSPASRSPTSFPQKSPRSTTSHSTGHQEDPPARRMTPLEKERAGHHPESHSPSRMGTADSRARRTPPHDLVAALQRLESSRLEADADLSEAVRSSIVLSRLPVWKSLAKDPAQRTTDDVTRIRGLLSVCGPMRGLSVELATEVSRRVVLEQFRHEQLCISEGDAPDRYFIILAGHVSVYQGRADGVPLRSLGPGEGFGELALLSGGARTATVKVQDQMGLVVVGLAKDDYGRTLQSLHTTTNLYHSGY